MVNKKQITEKIMFSENNEDHLAMRTVSIVIKGHQLNHRAGRPGYYEYILIDEKTNKYITEISEQELDMTPNRGILKGLIHGLSRLKYSCHIKVISKVSVGFKQMIKEGKSPNSDLLQELKQVILMKGHVIDEIVDIKLVENIFSKYRVHNKGRNSS